MKETEEELGFLVGNLEALGDRLGVVLFQLPPNLKVEVERLVRFQASLPESLPVAFEFRHESWTDEAVLETLRDHGHGLVLGDTDEAPLAEWAARLQAAALDEAFVFFKHEDEGAGPRMASELLAIAERVSKRRGAKPARTAAAPARRREAG